MPYIKKGDRPIFDPHIQTLTKLFLERGAAPGDVNYVFSKILKNLFEAKPSYTEANKLIGIVECVKLELYRRTVAPYEDQKIRENGDI